MSKNVTCAYCKQKINKEDAFVKHAGKNNTYYCNETHYGLAIERKKHRENRR